MHLILPSERRLCDFCLDHRKSSLLIVSPNGAICSDCVSACVAELASKTRELLEVNASAEERT